MAYFKPLPEPEPDARIRHLAKATGVIKPNQYIQYSRRRWRFDRNRHVDYYEEVEGWDGEDSRCIIGMYVYKASRRGTDPPTDAVFGDVIEYVPRCYND